MALRNIFISFLLLSAQLICAQTILWEETFEDESNGATSQAGASVGGTLGGTWSVTTTPTGGAASFSRQSYVYSIWFFGCIDLVTANLFLINGTGTEGVWQSNVIDISSLGDVALEMDLGISGGNASDYVRAFYRIDGGPEIQFGEVTGNGGIPSLTNTVSAILNGSTLQIIVRGFENTAGNVTACGTPVALGFDNVRLVDITTLYSIASGNWNNSNTWSYTGYGGTTCSPCLPSNDTKIFIGNNRTVNFNAAGDAIDVNIENTGRLQWTADNIDLNIRRGGSINISSGGILTLNGNAGAQIDFDDPYTNSINVSSGGSLSIGDIDINGGTALTLTGGGAFTVNDDFLMGVDNLVVTNNMTGTFTIIDQLLFEINNMDFVNNGSDMNVLGATGIAFTGDNNTLTNNGDLDVTGVTRSISFNTGATGNSVINGGTMDLSNVYFDDDNNSVVNTNALTLSADILAGTNDDGNTITNSGTLGFVTLNLADANFTINNSGTINQSGSFTNIDAGSNFNNLNGAVWNYSGTGHDPDTRLFANNGTNDFNYTAAGAQQLITPIDGYSNISLQNSGAKAALASFNVYGNWSRSGTATFTPAGFTVTFRGIGVQTISAVGSETFAGLTINNTFATSPQIIINNPVTVTGTLTMTDGNINLNSNTFTVGVSAAAPGVMSHGGAAANGWMYGGNLRRFMANAATTIGGGDQNEGFFPIGSASNFRPFFIGKNNVANSGGALTMTFTEASTTSNVTITDGAATITRRHDSFWSLSTSGITAGTWSLRAGGTNFGTIQELSDLRMSTSSGVVGTHAAATGSVADPRVNRTGLTFGQLANNFYVASTDAVNSPLPIKLLYLTAEQVETAIEVQWATSLQENFSHFVVQHSLNGTTFTDLAEVPGAGYNTESVIEYNYINKMPKIGINYYRLKAVDLDGSYEYFGPIAQSFSGTRNMRIYPNPTNGEFINVDLNFNPSEGSRLAILNTQGVEVMNLMGVGTSNRIELNSLTPGMYMLKFSSHELTEMRKFIVK